MFELMIEETFDAAHHLDFHLGKCKHVHGHTWKVKISVMCDTLNKNGIAMDFHDLKVILHSVMGGFDHSDLNLVMKDPTAERLAEYIYHDLVPRIVGRFTRLESVYIYESPTSGVRYYEP